MRHFTIYDKKTGEVLRSGACARDEDIHLQAKEGEKMLSDVRGCTIGQIVNRKTKRLNKRPANEVKRYHQAHTDLCAKADALASNHVSSDVLVALLQSKGIDITPADILAAVAKVRSGTTQPVGKSA